MPREWRWSGPAPGAKSSFGYSCSITQLFLQFNYGPFRCSMADLGRIHFLCQRCQQPLRLDSSLFSMDEHTMAQLSLPISPAPEVDLSSQAASLDRLVLPTKLTESGGTYDSYENDNSA